MGTYVICGTIKGIKYNSSGKIDACYFAPDQEFVVKTNYVKYHCAVLLPKHDVVSAFSFKFNESECLELKNIPQSSFLRVNGHYILELSKELSEELSEELSKDKENVYITIFSKNFKVDSITEIP